MSAIATLALATSCAACIRIQMSGPSPQNLVSVRRGPPCLS